MIDAIRTYIANCPLLDEYTSVNVEYLVDKVTAYSINENVGYNPVINEYVTGEKEMQYQFNFDAKFYWNEETQNNIDNAKFFEDFKDWLEQKNDNNEFDIEDVAKSVDFVFSAVDMTKDEIRNIKHELIVLPQKLEKILSDKENIQKCARQFSSFKATTQEQYRKCVCDMVNTVLPIWIQYRNTYINL